MSDKTKIVLVVSLSAAVLYSGGCAVIKADRSHDRKLAENRFKAQGFIGRHNNLYIFLINNDVYKRVQVVETICSCGGGT